MEGDIDNIVKPILDGMINVAYYDDQAIERVMVQKFEAGIDRVFTSLTGTLQAALVAAPPVVYVSVDDDLKWRSL